MNAQTVVVIPDDQNDHQKMPLIHANEVSSPRIIESRIKILTVGDVDTLNERFYAAVCIHSKWLESTQIEKYNETVHWNPKLFIQNAMPDLKEDITYSVIKLDDGQTEVQETRFSRGFFWERMELEDFPLDIQEISIILATRRKGSDVRINETPSDYVRMQHDVISTFRDQQEWTLYSLVDMSNMSSYDAQTLKDIIPLFKWRLEPRRPKLVATMYLSRKPGYFISNCYSFNFLITILSLTVFCLDPKLPHFRIACTFTLILTTVSFKLISSRSMPTISYHTSLDRYQIVNIVYLVLLCVYHSVITSLNISSDAKAFWDWIMLLVFSALFVFIQVILVIEIALGFRKVLSLRQRERNYCAQLNTIRNSDEDDDDF